MLQLIPNVFSQISDILQSFVFPESRSSFMAMLAAESVSIQPDSVPPPEFFSTSITH